MLVSECCDVPAGDYEDIELCPKCKEHCAWIDLELEKAKVNYQTLITRVEEINPEAAKYLKEEAPDLPNFAYTDDLKGVTLWSTTPQGFAYWCDLNDHLKETPDAPS